MVTFDINTVKDYDKLKQLINKYFFENEEITAANIIDMLFVLYEHGFIEKTSTGYVYTKLEDLFQPDKNRPGLLCDPYSTFYSDLCSSLIMILSKLGYTKFNFYDVGEKGKISLNRLLHTSPYPNKVTFRGKFYLSNPIENKRQKCCGSVIVEGEFELNNSYRSRAIELPPQLTLPPFTEIHGWDKEIKHYDSVKDYINRPERIERLIRNKKIRKAVKEANETGNFTLNDRYDCPLDKLCLVAYARNDLCSIGQVIGQTSKILKIRDMKSNLIFEVLPNSIVRIK